MTIAVVQTTTLGNGVSVNSITSAFASDLTVGSLVVAYALKTDIAKQIIESTAISVSAGTCVLGTFSQDINSTAIATNSSCAAIFSAIVLTGGSCTLTFSGAAAGSNLLLIAQELSGTWDGTRLSVANVNYSSVATTTVDSGNASTVGAAIFCGVANTSATTTWGAINNSFTSIFSNGSSTQDNGAAGYRIVPVITTSSFNWTLSGSGAPWNAAVVAYREGPVTSLTTINMPPLPVEFFEDESPIEPAFLDWLNNVRDAIDYLANPATSSYLFNNTTTNTAAGRPYIVIAVNYAATLTVDFGLYPQYAAITVNVGALTGNITLNFTNATAGQILRIRLLQDGTGSRTFTGGANLVFSADTPSPTLSTGANKADMLGFHVHSATAYYMVAVNRGF